MIATMVVEVMMVEVTVVVMMMMMKQMLCYLEHRLLSRKCTSQLLSSYAHRALHIVGVQIVADG